MEHYTWRLRKELGIIAAFREATERLSSPVYPAMRLLDQAAPKPAVTERTFVVLGCPRGGTSLLAGALHASGIYMGDFRTAQYEDPAFKVRPGDARRNPNIEACLLPVIEARNRTHRYWGWKVPNSIYYIQQIRHLLVNPVFLFVYREEEAIARSSLLR